MSSLLLLMLAALPPPDYVEAVRSDIEAKADRLIAANKVEEAASLLQSVRAHITDDARLTYSHGLALRLLGDYEQARFLLESSLNQDPSLASAWYDLGEIQVLTQQPEEATDSFERAASLSEGHPSGWAAPFRLSELAADAGKVAAFENWLEKAMERGFSFQQTVVGSERWGQYLQDPELGDIIRRLVTVHEDEALLDNW